MKKLILLPLMFLTLIVFAQKGKWKKAVATNTIEAYSQFVADYPTSKFLTEAAERIQYLAALQSKKDEDLKAFIDTYPNSLVDKEIKPYYQAVEKIKSTNRYIECLTFSKKYWNWPYAYDAKLKYYKLLYQHSKYSFNIEYSKTQDAKLKKELNDFLAEQSFNSMMYSTYRNRTTLNTFIEKYPDTKYAKMAQDTLDVIQQKQIKKEYVAAYKASYKMRSFITKYPDYEYTPIMKDSLLKLDYIEISKMGKDDYNYITKLERFAKNYPDSKHTPKIKEQLFSSVYAECQKEKSYTNYKRFLTLYPDSKYAPKMKSQLYGLHLEYAKKTNKATTYQTFLDENPNAPDTEEIECLLACKENTPESLNAFTAKYPNSKFQDKIAYKKLAKAGFTIEKLNTFKTKYPKSEYIEQADVEINDIKFVKRFDEVTVLIGTKWASKELKDKIDVICADPPIRIHYKEFRKFQSALTKFEKNKDKMESESEDFTFMYSFIELGYHISNAVGRSTMLMMMESLEYGGVAKIDPFTVVDGAQLMVGIELALLQVDKSATSRRRGYQSLLNILNNNDLKLSKKWTNGEQIRGLEVMMLGIPLNLKEVRIEVLKLQKTETNSANKALINKIMTKLNY